MACRGPGMSGGNDGRWDDDLDPEDFPSEPAEEEDSDDEAGVLGACVGLLQRLSSRGQDRVLRYLLDRFVVVPKPKGGGT